MSNPVDSVEVLYNSIISGLVVSGNSNIVVSRSLTSGDAMTSFKLLGAGTSELIALRLVRNTTTPQTGGYFNSISDYVQAQFYGHYTTSGMPSSGAIANLQQRMADFKTTVLSGTWSSGCPPIPMLTAEEHPMSNQQVTRGSLTYRFHYLL